jgi:antitoxin CcdA
MHTPDNIPGMKRRAASPRKATNVTLSEPLLAEAKTLGISVSQAAEAGVAQAVAKKRAEIWARENHEALQSSNAYVEQHGLPLAKYRPH